MEERNRSDTLFIPKTIENVGSEGRLFTDNVMLKMILCFVLTAITFMLISGIFNSFRFPRIVGLVVASVFSVFLFIQLCLYIPFRLNTLIRLFKVMSDNKVLDVSVMSDIYDVNKDGVFFHKNGYISAMIYIERGTTLGMSREQRDRYFSVFKNIENSILMDGLNFDRYSFELSITSCDVYKKQIKVAHMLGLTELEHTLILRNKYAETLMKKCATQDILVYVIHTKMVDLKMFTMKLKQLVLVNNPNILSVRQLYEKEAQMFGQVFFDVTHINLLNNSGDVKSKIELLD